jgi:DNA-binding transcriptional ArsR family regulator
MLRNGPEAPAQDLEPLAGLFKLLSDGTRLRILLLLSKGERNVSSLCEELKLPQPTVSHHLGLLRMKHIISNRRHGKQVFYGLNGQVQAAVDAGSLKINGDSYSVEIGPRAL